MNFLLFIAILVVIGLLVWSTQSQSFKTKSQSTPLDNFKMNASASASLQPTTLPTTVLPSIDPVVLNALKSATTTAVIKTQKGDITVELYSKEAPNTVINFLTKAKNGFYNNLTFHRVEDWVVQGGDPKGNGTGGGQIASEINNKPFVKGSLGQARGGDIRISNDSQFFITKTDAAWLNGQYVNFGIVTKGMDVVQNLKIGDKILGIDIGK